MIRKILNLFLRTRIVIEKIRCEWPQDELHIKYHDYEWGVPIHNDNKLFEFLTLSGAQAGLSWSTILKRRKGYKKAFANFDPRKVAKYNQKRITELLKDPSIIRNRLKISSTVNNAKQFIKIQDEFGSFDKYIWSFVNYKQVKNKFKKSSDLPASTKLSDTISHDLKKRGFTFVGTTICYAYIQSVGLVNDHTIRCFRYNKV